MTPSRQCCCTDVLVVAVCLLLLLLLSLCVAVVIIVPLLSIWSWLFDVVAIFAFLVCDVVDGGSNDCGRADEIFSAKDMMAPTLKLKTPMEI